MPIPAPRRARSSAATPIACSCSAATGRSASSAQSPRRATSIESVLKVGDRSYEIHRIGGISGVERLPYTLRILLENVLRTAGDEDVAAVSLWEPEAEPSREISFSPARAIHQDFTGVPAIVDL